MTGKALKKKNNMARTPFKLRSGNTPTTSKEKLTKFLSGFFGGVSKAKQDIEKRTKRFGSDVEGTVKRVKSTVNPDRKGKKYTKAKRKPGESQYQADVRARREAKKASMAKNYRNPQDYKVFNMGNEPTPFTKRKKY